MSRPYAFPEGPTRRAERSTSMPPPEPRSSTVSPASSWASAVGLPQPSEAAVALLGRHPVSVAEERLEVMGWPSRPDALPQEALPPAATVSAALPYLSFTICLMSASLMTASSRRAAGRPATLATLGQLESQGLLGHGGLVLEIVVEVVHLPLHAVGILDPELVLVGVAAVDAHLFAHGQACRLDAGEVVHDRAHRVHLNADVIHRALGRVCAFREGEVDGSPVGQELHVARLRLDGPRAEEALVEVTALAEIRYVQVQVDLCAHEGLLQQQAVSRRARVVAVSRCTE